MPMFRFWATDSRGSDKTADGSHQLPVYANPVASKHSGLPTPVSPKKRRPSFVDTAAYPYPPDKRIKSEQNGDLPSPVSASPDLEESLSLRSGNMESDDLEAAKDAIQMQFGLEILLKHDELRLINQELAKCQVALEQLRRCHLIPYPTQCPTPSQMLDISSGRGPALQSRRGEPVPKWAPPFGVVEGPYARHYAKWLIPDPMFDGIQPELQGVPDTGRARNVGEGRATRSSISDAAGSGKQRPVRGMAGQRLQALSSGYPQPKDKQSPCTVKRSDGVTVKLVCIDCHRWDFSSTQGFINHCRIAHKRDFKSHEEAAVHCGHPIEVDDSGAILGDDRKAPAAAPSGLVHPLASSESIPEHQVYQALLSRVNASLELYKAGRLPGVSSIPRAPTSSRAPSGESRQPFVGSSDAPYLSRLMQKKKLGGNLKEQVDEAKKKVDLDWLSAGEESDTDDATTTRGTATSDKSLATASRAPAAMRMPSRAAVPPSQPPAAHRAASQKGHHTADLEPELPETPMYDVEMDVDMSPNTMASNNAPSLVSDDGEYDDSDDGSASETSEAMEVDSESDVAEINIDDDSDAREDTPRTVPRRRASTSKATKLKKDESRHVTFVSPTPVPPKTTGRRKKKN
jgi:ADA HAT complex component 1